MKQKFLFLLMMIFSLVGTNISAQVKEKNPKNFFLEKYNTPEKYSYYEKNIRSWYFTRESDGRVSIIINKSEEPLSYEGVNHYVIFNKKRYPLTGDFVNEGVIKQRYAESFTTQVKLDSVHKSFFYSLLLKRKDIKVFSVLDRGIRKYNVIEKDNDSSKGDSFIKFNYVFFLYCILLPLILYLVNNNKKIGKINFSLKSDQELPLFKVLFFWLFGLILLSSQEEYIFNSFYEVLKKVKWINWVFDTHLLFSLVFSLSLMIIYYLILELIGIVFNSESVLKDRIQIILLVSFIYSLIVGLKTEEIYFFNNPFIMIIMNLLLFIVIYFVYFLIMQTFNYIFKKDIMIAKKRKEIEKLKEEINIHNVRLLDINHYISSFEDSLLKTKDHYEKDSLSKRIEELKEEKINKEEKIKDLEQNIFNLKNEIKNI